MANSLPMTLRVYRGLSSAVVPFAPALIRQRLRLGKEDPERMAERRGLTRDVLPGFADGTLRPVLDSVFPLERASDAHRRMAANENVGKIVLTVP